MKKSELFLAFLQVPIDAIMIIIAFILAYYVRTEIGFIGFHDAGLYEYLKYALYAIPVWVALFSINSLYSVKNTTGFLHEFAKITVASSAAILFFVMLIFLTKTFFFSRLILVFIWAISIFTLIFGRLFLRIIRKALLIKGIGTRQVLFIGNNSASEAISKNFAGIFTGFKVIGVVGKPKKDNSNLKMVGDLSDLQEIIKKYKIDEVILTESNISDQAMAEIVQVCSDLKAGFKFIPDVFALTSSFKPGLIGTIPVMELKSIPIEGWGRIIKRIIDFIVSLVLLIILSPIFMLIAALIRISSKGPVIYRHKRVGRDERAFNFYKFRSMYIEKCDFKDGVYWTTKEDEKTRVTPLGRFLRKTNLDELPQLWNIFKGDMSFVGPRPELPKLVEKFGREIPGYFRRHKVKSGLTGWAQVNGLKGDTSIEERVRYDNYYITNWSMWLDCKIIIKTIWLVAYEAVNGKFEYRTRP